MLLRRCVHALKPVGGLAASAALRAAPAELSAELSGHHSFELDADELLGLVGWEALPGSDAVDELLLDVDSLRRLLEHPAVQLEQLRVLAHLREHEVLDQLLSRHHGSGQAYLVPLDESEIAVHQLDACHGARGGLGLQLLRVF